MSDRYCLNCDWPLTRNPGERPSQWIKRIVCDRQCAEQYRWADRMRELRHLLEGGRPLIDIPAAIYPDSISPTATLARQLHRHGEHHLGRLFERTRKLQATS